MTEKKKRSGPISAGELLEQLANDPEFQRQKRERDAKRETRRLELRRAEQPIVADLRAAGLEVDSVWDLVNTSVPYPDFLPILMEHLERGGYPDRVMESLGRALAVKPSVMYWDRFKALLLAPRCKGEQTGVAVAMAACVTAAQIDDLMDLLTKEECGENRVLFVGKVLRLGKDRGRDLVESLRDDPVVGKEATALLKRRKKRVAPPAE